MVKKVTTAEAFAAGAGQDDDDDLDDEEVNLLKEESRKIALRQEAINAKLEIAAEKKRK